MKDIKYEYEVIKKDDGMYGVCEYRWMDHSVNVKTIFTSGLKKECNEFLKKYKKGVK